MTTPDVDRTECQPNPEWRLGTLREQLESVAGTSHVDENVTAFTMMVREMRRRQRDLRETQTDAQYTMLVRECRRWEDAIDDVLGLHND